MRDKAFYLNSIKMDLHRVVAAVGDITKPVPEQSAKEFLEHALADFNKVDTTPLEESLKAKLFGLARNLTSLQDPYVRLRWVDDILTIRCRI